MYIGTVVVQNELLGILVKETDTEMTIKTKDGKLVTVKKRKYAEVTTPYALACLFYTKLVSNIRRN